MKHLGAKRDFFWNSIAGVINSLEAVVISMIVTRLMSLSDAGITTIAFAVGNLLLTIGKFGVRNYQVTDVNNKYSAKVYFILRIVTVFFMAIATGLYTIYAYSFLGYHGNKVSCIVAMSMIYCLESIEDVFWGDIQKKGRLDLGAKMFCIRWISIFVVFTLCSIVYRNLEISLWACAIFSAIVFGVNIFVVSKKIDISVFNSNVLSDKTYRSRALDNTNLMRSCIELLAVTFPLFAVNFLTILLNNLPKYAIDGVLSDEVQACYGFVAMPVFIIGLLNSFIYQPSLVKLSVEWSKRTTEFSKMIIKQILVLIAISLISILGAAIMGIPVLSVIFGTDLSDYWFELIILQVAGMFLALSAYLSVVLITMRHNKVLMWGYVSVSILSLSIMNKCVMYAGTKGAAFAYMICMVILCMIYSTMFVYYFRRER